MPSIEKMHFKTSSGIKSIVGKDLITDRFIAIFELVKNGYDAGATDVIVSFNSHPSSHIVIRDNGKGMTKDDLQNKWLHLAYSEKKEGQKSSYGRVAVGSKGIGRFSCDSLGATLQIITKVVGETHRNILNVSWTDFEQSLEQSFESVGVNYSLEKLPIMNINDHYTELVINNLHHEWDKNTIDRVINSLRRLKNPFLVDDGFNIYCGKDISQLQILKKSDLVFSNVAEVLKDKSITVEVDVSEHITVSLWDRGKSVYKISKGNDSIFKDIKLNIVINYLTRSAKVTFARRMGVDAVRYGNIFVYRNGFNVSPYGAQDYDLFGLNIRKTQGHRRYLGTREIIGYINISDEHNLLKEASSRNNGFVQSIYSEALKDIYMEYGHKLLEKYVLLVQWGETKDTFEEISLSNLELSETEKFKKSLLKNDFELLSFSSDIDIEEYKPTKRLEKIVDSLPWEQQKSITAVIDQVDDLIRENKTQDQVILQKIDTITALERQNKNLTEVRSEISYGEQISHHFSAMSDRLKHSVDGLSDLRSVISDKVHQKVLMDSLRSIRRTQIELILFKDLLIKSSYEMRSPQIINWFDLTQWYFKEKNSDGDKALKTIIHSADGMNLSYWDVRSNVLEFVMMLENFYQNAKDHDSNYLDIHFDYDALSFTSDSGPIKPEYFDKIFERGFTTKENGTGIGLNQVKLFLNKIKFTVEVSNEHNIVCFKIKKKKEN